MKKHSLTMSALHRLAMSCYVCHRETTVAQASVSQCTPTSQNPQRNPQRRCFSALFRPAQTECIGMIGMIQHDTTNGRCNMSNKQSTGYSVLFGRHADQAILVLRETLVWFKSKGLACAKIVTKAIDNA